MWKREYHTIIWKHVNTLWWKNLFSWIHERIYFLESLLESKSNHTNSEINDIEFRCRFCEEKFNNKASPKKHIQENHPAFFKCKSCKEVFNESWKMEVHMKTRDRVNPYKCDICDKEFIMNWRLKKHKTSHNGSSKFCHFFNNKNCPFEEIGCMFIHEDYWM